MKTYPTNQILKNKIAIITGAGSGIGKCMVERFVQEGAQCLAADLNQDSLNALVEDLGDFAGMVRTLQVDVSDRSQVENMVEEAVKQFGGLDILVNNPRSCPIAPTPPRSARRWRNAPPGSGCSSAARGRARPN